MLDDDAPSSIDIVSYGKRSRAGVPIAKSGQDLSVRMIRTVHDIATVNVMPDSVGKLRTHAQPQTFDHPQQQRPARAGVDAEVELAIEPHCGFNILRFRDDLHRIRDGA